ncbi:hypothetical protein OQA88_13256 [Cercophora sp. LCS_1]
MDPFAGPPPPNVTRGPMLVTASIVMHVVSPPILATRIWSRASPSLHLWWDDYTMLIAAVTFDFINWVLILLAVSHGFGRPTFHVPPESQPKARLPQYFAQHASIWALTFAKISVASMLYRLRQDRKPWRVFLRFMMGALVIIALAASAILFAAARPLAAMWDFRIPNPKYLPMDVINQGILSTAIMAVITDFILALLPLGFVLRLRRSLRERLVVALVMSLGLVASAASICKIASVTSTKLTGDPLVGGVDVTFWGMLETQLAIIAACIPCLKRLMENVLRRMGLITSKGTAPNTYYLEQTGAAATSRNNGTVPSRVHNGTAGFDADITDEEDDVRVLKQGAA